MAHNVLQKILSAHLVSGKPIPGEDIGLKICQVFANDATGPLTMLQFEAIGLPRAQVELAAIHVDRTVLQTRPEDADDQLYLATIAARAGAALSRAGNGAAPLVHLERFAVPGKTLLAADTYAAVCGAAGMLAIGAGTLEVAAAMAAAPFYMPMPRVLGVRLAGRLQPWMTAKDAGLELLRRLGTRGAIGRVLEFTGDGTAALTVPERAAIAAVAAETGAVSVLFPSDDQTRRFLETQGRVRFFTELQADPACEYDETLEIDLAALEPLAAKPGSPADVVLAAELPGIAVSQVVVGSFAEPAIEALRAIAAITSGRGVSPGVSAVVLPGSRQVLLALAQSGDLERLVAAGWRILEPGCGPELGIGQVPAENGASVRTFSRNTAGRSGREGDAVYLTGPLVAAATAITGVLTDPRTLGIDPPRLEPADRLPLDDRLVSLPATDTADAPVRRPPHLKLLPAREPLGIRLEAPVVLKVGDRVGAEDILPTTPEAMALRTDAAALADHLFAGRGRSLAARSRAAGGGIVVAGADFGHGPGREAMAMALAAADLVAVVAKDFARVNRSNLVSFGILPLLLVDPADHDRLEEGDALELPDVRAAVRSDEAFAIRNLAKGTEIAVRHGLTNRQKDIVLAGGVLPWARRHGLSPSIV